jgi:tetratricopeptide (TPR) repeat protein
MRRGDFGAATKLGRRGWELLPPRSTGKLLFVPHLFFACCTTAEWSLAEGIVSELAEHSDTRSWGYAELCRAELAALRRTRGDVFDADRARSSFRTVGDELGLALLERRLALDNWMGLRVKEAGQGFARGAAHADHARATSLARELHNSASNCRLQGPMPLAEVIELLPTPAQPGHLARIRAMQREFDEAWALFRRQEEDARERGSRVAAAATSQTADFIARHEGREERAVPILTRAVAELEELGERAYLSTTVMNLAMLLERLGDVDEAARLVARAEELTQPDDVVDAGGLAWLGALLAARRDDDAEALAALERALAIAEPLEFFQLKASTYVAAARTYLFLGRRDDARAWADKALRHLEAKGDVAWADRVRELVVQL